MEDKYLLKVEISGDAEKKLNADIETATKRSKQKVEELTGAFKTSSEKIIAYGKLVNDKERADQRIRVAETKSQLDIKYANVKAALDKEVIAVQGGKEMEVKAAINARKLMESELRTYEAFNRNILSKELADYKANLQAKLSEQRRTASMLNNAPRTTLKGSIGSEGYTSQLMASQRKMLPGSEEFTQTGLLIDRYKTKLKEAGIETLALADKTSLFRQKAVNLGADLTVLTFGVRGIVGDIKNLTTELKSGEAGFGAVAESVGLASLQILTMIPAINALRSAFVASTGALKLFTVGASVLLSGIAAVGSAVTLLVGNISNLAAGFDRIGKVLSGQMGFWQAMKENISAVTFGMIDLTDATDNAARSMEQLLALSSVSGKEFDNLIDSQNYESKFKEGGEFHGQYTKEEQAALIQNYKALQNVQTEFEAGEERLIQHKRNQADMLYDELNKKEKKVKSTKEEAVLLNREQEILKEIANLQKQIAIETLPAQTLIFEGQIKQLRIQLEILKQTNAERGKMFEGVLPKGNILPTTLNEEIERMKLGVSLTNETGEETKKEEKMTLSELVSKGMDFAKQLTSVLQIGAETFIGKLLSGLQSAISLANSLISFLSGVFNLGADIASGGIFGLIGGLFSAPMQNPTSRMMGSSRSGSPIVINMAGNLSRLGMYEITSTGGQVALRYGDRNL